MLITDYINKHNYENIKFSDINNDNKLIFDIMQHESNIKNHKVIYENCEHHLIVRSRIFYIDNLLIYNSDAKNVLENKLKKALSAIRRSANNRIINGAKSATDFDGLKNITQYNNMYLTNPYFIKNKHATKDMIKSLEYGFDKIDETATHLIVGADGYLTLKNGAKYSDKIDLTDDDKPNSMKLGYIELNKKIIPVIWAGKVGTGAYINNEVIYNKSGEADMYLVDLSEKGVTFAFEIFPLFSCRELHGIEYMLEATQHLCVKSPKNCFKLIQYVDLH